MNMRAAKLKILVLDDDPAAIEIFSDKLDQLGIAHELTVFETGREALNYLESTEVLPDLMTLDIYLPEEDGFEILKKMKAHRRLHSIPVLVMSCSERSKDVAAAYRNGGAVFVSKSEESKFLGEILDHLRIFGMLK